MPTRSLRMTLLATLVIAGGLGGCSSKRDVVVADPACRANPASCIHEGAYDAGEREYAEREAARLNQAARAKLRRG